MKNYKILSFLVLWTVSFTVWGQAINISGKVEDEQGNPLKGAHVYVKSDQFSTSDIKGNYRLQVPSHTSIILTVEHIGFSVDSKSIITTDEDIVVDFKLKTIKEKVIPEIVFKGARKKSADITMHPIDMKNLDNTPTLSGGVEEILNTVFVSTASELSSFYRVRGGNYDENLVYINGVEIYKPLSVRSGQQEGMSIINPDMVSTVNFSAGGFESRYGDKMSSVLDIAYRKPKKFETKLEASLLGGGTTFGFADKKNKFSGILGARYRNTDLILNTFDGDTDFNPEYFDVQTFLQYTWAPKWKLSFLGNYASNEYKMVPKKREVEFGTLHQPIKLNVAYNGNEKDTYKTANGTLSLEFKPTDNLAFNLDGYAFHSKEHEYFDISAGYMLQEADHNTGDFLPSFNSGGQINHGRNNLDMLVLGTQLKSKYNLNINSALEAGFQYQHEDIRNLKNEWQLIDSAGYSIPRPILPPGDLDESDLILLHHVSANNKLLSNRINGYLQYSTKFLWNTSRVLINAGVRATYWDFNGETNFSPRAQIALKPDWKIDMLFRFATGFYYQPPFYKEAMRLDGILNDKIKSQRSIHFILGNDFEFKMLNKHPFKLTTEIYYKKLDDLIPYFLDNVRVIYTGENNSKGYAYGIDARLNGEFVSGAESWLSVSYGKTEENIDGRGYIPRPTDPRLKVGLFFQDYMKNYPRFKANVNLVYASGLPNGAPLYSDPYDYQTTLSDYKRADVGLTYVFVDQKKNKARIGTGWERFKELSLGLEIFNVFNVRNTISNEWIRDINSTSYYAVPNKLTGRFFNVKLNVKL
ncbi:Outer membrane receptor proteins, mostly Fe transport [Apibacter mensalis]|uniref:Outer membrane receptor proteins, mostly Fe transport n=1 Tax=Apibacter mensalis TaxID=1586267 RepID=A0A0X3ARA7_9FLAO|nr:carboxypeptidase-like regulatory domain-containing protein [Apibacter mensalis]CVK16595.1 Outer membrane receptor proteins, mostly Fe transport [Apibacter mensalis]